MLYKSDFAQSTAPLFMDDSAFSTDFDRVLFSAPPTPAGVIVDVYSSCAKGTCQCLHFIDGVRRQLRPCRFAYLLYGGFVPVTDSRSLVFHGVTDGFRIIDSEVGGYQCPNYRSILTSHAKPLMDDIVRKEISEGYVSQVSEKPVCVHALGAVPKGDNRIRPITDCSRPPDVSVNNHCSSLVRKFSYSSIQDVVQMIGPEFFMSVVDIQSAYRAVPIFPGHRPYLGFQWELNGIRSYYVDNRLCFGLAVGPYYFHTISCFVADVLRATTGSHVVQYLDDYIVASPTYNETARSQAAIIRLLRYLGFYVSWKKISQPSKITTYLGIVIDTTRMELRLPQEKVNKFKEMVTKYVRAIWITRKKLENSTV